MKQGEVCWIAEYWNRGYDLLNLTAGGDGSTGYTWTEEQCSAQSDRLTGRVFSAEHLENLSAANKARTGYKHTEETIEKLRRAHTGKVLTDEHKESIRVGVVAAYRDPEVRAKCGYRKRGVPHDPTHSAKIGDALRGIPKSAQARFNMSLAKHKQHHTSEKINRAETCTFCPADGTVGTINDVWRDTSE
jgi:ribosomal protein S17